MRGERNKMKKKKGRPSLLDLQLRNSNNNNNNNNNNKSNNKRNISEIKNEINSDSDERTQKKVKLVVRLPSSHSVVKPQKKTHAHQGSPLECGPTVPLPDKKLLLFILERLQKKDTHGVFSEPVDPNELPDYFEVIERPMDFGTVRRKLDEGSYANLDDFESDVLLICANAMQYNGSDSVYFRQAKSIQEIAKRDFQNLRQVNDDGELQPKIVRRGRPPGLKKALGSPPLERVGPESSSDATLATAGDNSNNHNNNNDDIKDNINDSNIVGPNSYNLRKGLPSFRSQSFDAFFKASPQSRNNETHADYTTDWNSEFPIKILRAETKYGKKHFPNHEDKRATYKQLHPSDIGHDSSSLATLDGNMKHLIGVGLFSEHGYARSLARFAANLGPVVWKIASKKIENALPNGVSFGPGWVGENDVLPPSPQPSIPPLNNLVHDSNSSHHQAGPASFEAVAGQMSHNEQSVIRNIDPRIGSPSIMEVPQKHLLHIPNGFNHLAGYESSTQTNMLRAGIYLPTGGQQYGVLGAKPSTSNHSIPEPNMGLSSVTIPQNISALPASEIVSSQHHRPYNGVIPVPPDLNVKFQAPGSPTSSFPVGSPQPDLALQL